VKTDLRFMLALAIALVTACMAAPVMADEASDKQRALQLFKESEAAYEQGRFNDAITLLRDAYALKKEPVLLYNLGRALEGVGDLEGAIKAYEDFLVADPKAPDRGALEQRIATMRRQLDERRRLERERANPETPPSPAPEKRSNTPWIVAGVGAGVVAIGSVLGGVALSKHNDALDEPSHERASERDAESRDFQRWANVALVTGGTMLVIGLAWGLLRGDASPPKSAITSLTVRFP
jgi:tetratricopeptide (TPR) repeat protein